MFYSWQIYILNRNEDEFKMKKLKKFLKKIKQNTKPHKFLEWPTA